MDKKSRISIIIILLIIATISAYLIYTYAFDKSNNTNTNTTNTNVVSNEVNAVNNTVQENKVEENKTVENEVTNKVETNTATEKPHSEVSYANGEEQAMKIAKDAWGDTEGVYFSKESINANGEYVIVVTADAKVLARYTIDVDTGLYDVEYR